MSRKRGTCHSVIVPFVKKIFPNSKIVPLVIKDSLSEKEADAAIQNISKYVKDDVLVLGSFDFSHDSLPNIAEERDLRSLNILNNQNYKKIYTEVSVDSKPGLYILSKLMEIKNKKFFLIENTNSSILTKNPNQEDTTSYIVGYFK